MKVREDRIPQCVQVFNRVQTPIACSIVRLFMAPFSTLNIIFFNVLKIHNKARINFLSRHQLIFLLLKIIKLSHSYFLRFWIL